MAEKRILIADADAKAWDELRRALGETWTVVGATSGEAALAEAEKLPFDVVVANFNLPGMGGAELLNRIRLSHPKTIRFAAVAEAIKEKGVCDTADGHQLLAVPFDPAGVKSAIERALAADYGMSRSLRELVGRIRTFPTMPTLYLEVVEALKDPNATTADIGDIIAKDMAMTTKMVQVLNSAYYGLPRTITDPTEAVGILGFETVKSLVMTIKLLSQYDKVKPAYFSIDSIWRHSTNVARTARVMALLETGDTDCSSTAYTAGLMHDLGKVILATNFDSQYHGAHTVARKQQIPLWDVEKDIFGASHGDIGAYLLNLWGLSPEVVRVAALHHHPSSAGDKIFSALTAVHVANALEYEGTAEADGLPPPVVDRAYLQALGLEERVELWRMARHEPDPSLFLTHVPHAKPPPKPAAPAPVAEPPSDRAATVASPPGPFAWQAVWRWLGIGLGVSAALVLLARLEIMRLEHEAARPAIEEVAATPPQVARHETAAIVPPIQTPVGAKTVAAPTNAAIEIPPTNAVTLIAAQTPPVTPPAPQKTALDRLKLQAIFFSTQHPSALINGRLAGVDEEVADCRVLDISPGSVTLEFQHQRKTLTLR
jgi:HD-like signal output (HDOD) protein